MSEPEHITNISSTAEDAEIHREIPETRRKAAGEQEGAESRGESEIRGRRKQFAIIVFLECWIIFSAGFCKEAWIDYENCQGLVDIDIGRHPLFFCPDRLGFTFFDSLQGSLGLQGH